MTTLVDIRTDVQNRVTDSTGKFWSTPMLNIWINQAIRDITRRSETLETVVTMAAPAGQESFYLPTNLYRIHRAEFLVNANAIYVLEQRNYREMDSLWGINKVLSMAYPSYFTVWGVMGIDAALTLYPVPSQAGSLGIFAYRLPNTLVADTDQADIPIGWEDLVSLYCEYCALRRDSDPRWQDAKQLYTDELESMIELTRTHHDQASWITPPPQNMGTWAWMAGDEWGGGY
jgi:hypothetical protein